MIVVNGEPSTLAAGQTVADLLVAMGLDREARGVAVAVDGEVVPRAGWEHAVLGEDTRVEVLHAVQGG